MSASFDWLRDRPAAAHVWAKPGEVCKEFGFQNVSARMPAPDRVERAIASVQTPVDVQPWTLPAESQPYVSGEWTHNRHRTFVAQGIGERLITASVEAPLRREKSTREVTHRVTGHFGRTREIRDTQAIYTPKHGGYLELGWFDGSDNPAYAYAVGYDILTRDNPLGAAYLDGFDRRGRRLTVTTILPQAEAFDLTTELINKPRNVRRYAEFVLRECIGVPETEVPMPDYEKVDAITTKVHFAAHALHTPAEGYVATL